MPRPQLVVERALRHDRPPAAPCGAASRILVEARARTAGLGRPRGRRGSRCVPAKIDQRPASRRAAAVLALLEDLDQPLAAVELRLRRLVEVGAELRERRQLAVLREDEAQRARDLLHRLDLRVAADARHRDADVHRRADAGVEEVGLEEDLAVGDRDHVGRDVGRDVAGLGLDDRERRERAAAAARRSACERARAGASGGRRRRRDTPRGPADGAAAARSRGTPRRAWTGRRRCRARRGPGCLRRRLPSAP